MKAVYKYPIHIENHQLLWLPEGSTILSVLNQNEVLTIYALVDNKVEMKTPVYITIHSTGGCADDVGESKFLGTVAMDGGSLVYHVFYKFNS